MISVEGSRGIPSMVRISSPAGVVPTNRSASGPGGVEPHPPASAADRTVAISARMRTDVHAIT
jgi:hypothetical protein